MLFIRNLIYIKKIEKNILPGIFFKNFTVFFYVTTNRYSIKVGHLNSETKFDTNPTVDDQPYYITNNRIEFLRVQSSLKIFAQKYGHKGRDTYFIFQHK